MPAEDYRPTLEDVGAVTLSRTVDKVGVQVGTFTADTVPTDSQVEILIDKALGEISRKIGTDIPVALQSQAADLVAYQTAALIELSLFAHEIRSNISPYPLFLQYIDEQLPILFEAINAEEAGQSALDAFGNLPRYGFPEPSNILGGII